MNVVQLLLSDPRVDVNACDQWNGDTALHLAVQKKNNLEVVTALVEAGADINICNKKGQKPIDMAVDPKEITEIFKNKEKKQ